MRKIVLLFFLSVLLVQPIISQTLKINLYGGGGGSDISYSYGYSYGFTFIGMTTQNYSIQGYYMWGINIAYPSLINGFGIFLETNNRIANVSPISLRSNILVTGFCWDKHISKFDLELLGGFGYSWDKYELTLSEFQKYSITNGIPVIHGGFNFYYPINNFLEITLGGRVTKNFSNHLTASSIIVDKNGLKVPSLLFTGLAGISINIFDLIN